MKTKIEDMSKDQKIKYLEKLIEGTQIKPDPLGKAILLLERLKAKGTIPSSVFTKERINDGVTHLVIFYELFNQKHSTEEIVSIVAEMG